MVQIGEPGSGLPGAGLPRSVIRRILPPSESGSWASDRLPVSPVETKRLPSGANCSLPPSWMKPFGMPVRIGFGAESRLPSNVIRTTRLSWSVVT